MQISQCKPCKVVNSVEHSSFQMFLPFVPRYYFKTFVLHNSHINPLSSPLFSIVIPKNPFQNLACVTWHTGCGILPAIRLTLLSFILLLTLCASLEYNCLNPGIFTILSIISVMLLARSPALYAKCMKTAVFARMKNDKNLNLGCQFPPDRLIPHFFMASYSKT